MTRRPSSPRTLPRLVATPVLVLVVVLGVGGGLVGCGGSDASADRTVFTLRQAAPELTSVDTNDAGDLGDELVFSAPLTKGDRPFGAVLGILSDVGTNPQGRVTVAEERLAALVFDLPGGTISVFSLSYYEPGRREMGVQRPVVRAVVGGTGRFIGARGEVRTIRAADGTYRHVFTLLD